MTSAPCTSPEVDVVTVDDPMVTAAPVPAMEEPTVKEVEEIIILNDDNEAATIKVEPLEIEDEFHPLSPPNATPTSGPEFRPANQPCPPERKLMVKLTRVDDILEGDTTISMVRVSPPRLPMISAVHSLHKPSSGDRAPAHPTPTTMGY